MQDILKCKKDFTQKEENFYHRQQNVDNAFMVIDNVKDKSILILDDLYTTGSTIKEVSKTLFENGAKDVHALLLAVNQTIETNSTSYNALTCPICQNKMELKINNKSKKLFFACPSYKLHKQNNNNITYPVLVGLEKLKVNNKLELTDFDDLLDIY